MGLDHAKWAQSYLSAQYTLEYYKARGMIPEYKLFESNKPEVLRMLFEFRPPDSQVSTQGLWVSLRSMTTKYT